MDGGWSSASREKPDRVNSHRWAEVLLDDLREVLPEEFAGRPRIASYPDPDKGRIQFWVEQFGEARDLPELWTEILKLL